ncbi:XRE family transcriptional regulator [Mariprofundus ferrooxydans]|nr:XRE family transcriptional regulator [Mariprofundus ferrooxydans]
MKPIDELEIMFAETGELDEVRALAAKKVLTADIQLMMDNSNLSKAQLAREIHTARPVVDRLLDPKNTGVTLKTIAKAAAVLGGQIRLQV